VNQPLVVTVPHQLGRAEARRRVEDGIGQLTAQFAKMGEVKSSWAGDVLNYEVVTMGQMVSGRVDVGDASVRIEVVLPGFLGMIAGSLRGRLQKQGELLLEDKTKR
jgi:putative polyhydroxyalkanoate system protein